MTNQLVYIAMVSASLLGLSCQSTDERPMVDSITYQIPKLFYDSSYHVFVETPVGSSQKLRYNHSTKQLDTLVVEEGIVPYLPYPVGEGFFPVLRNDSLEKIPVWIIGQRLTSGQDVAVHLLGLIDYRDRSRSYRAWLVSPVDTLYQTIESQRFRDFIIRYDAIKFMFEYWLKNRHGIGTVSQIQWQDEEKALAYLQERINKN